VGLCAPRRGHAGVFGPSGGRRRLPPPQYGGAKAPRYILVDGGAKCTYEEHLGPAPSRLEIERIELGMVSHVEDDHIAGMLKLFQLGSSAFVEAHPRKAKAVTYRVGCERCSRCGSVFAIVPPLARAEIARDRLLSITTGSGR
jgi:hypothetical protein